MTFLLLAVIAVLLLGCAALTWALVICDRTLEPRAVRLHRQAERIRDYRAENRLLALAVDELAAAGQQRATASAALTPDQPVERPWPGWGYRVLHQIQTAASLADLDRKDTR